MSIPPIYKYAAVALLVLLLAVAAAVSIGRYGANRYAAGDQAGRNAVLASATTQAQQLQQQHAALEQFSSFATTALNQWLSHEVPAIQEQTHATTEVIRTIYRARPAGDLCARPAGVQEQLDQAVARANAAIAAPDRQL